MISWKYSIHFPSGDEWKGSWGGDIKSNICELAKRMEEHNNFITKLLLTLLLTGVGGGGGTLIFSKLHLVGNMTKWNSN